MKAEDIGTVSYQKKKPFHYYYFQTIQKFKTDQKWKPELHPNYSLEFYIRNLTGRPKDFRDLNEHTIAGERQKHFKLDGKMQCRQNILSSQ